MHLRFYMWRGKLNVDDPVAKYLEDWPVFEEEVTIRPSLDTHKWIPRSLYDVKSGWKKNWNRIDSQKLNVSMLFVINQNWNILLDLALRIIARLG